MRFLPFLTLCSCLTMFGVHHARARGAFVEAMGACEDVTAEADSEDGWLWRTHGCGKEAWCWYGRPSGDMRCNAKRPTDLLDVVVRADLKCSDGELKHDRADNDHEWARLEFTGCDRIAWCTDDKADKLRCTSPDDMNLAVKQLAVETGCPPGQIEQLQFYGTTVANTYRFNACGSQFSCVVPMGREKDNRGNEHGPRVAMSVFGSQLSCKAVGTPLPAVAVPPPPPPTTQP